MKDVDINDLELGDDVPLEGFEEGKDFFTSPPPPDDATYIGTLKLQDGSGIKQGTTKTGQTFYQVSVEARIKDGGKFDNRPIFDRVNTVVLSGSTRVAGILQALEITPPNSAKAQIKALVDALAGEPQVKFTTSWRSAYISGKKADGKDEYTNLYKGQKKHPLNGDGRYKHVNKAPDGTEVTAQAEIIKYAPVG